MRFILADAFWQRARALDVADPTRDVHRDLERMVAELGVTRGFAVANARLEATESIALSPRRGGLLLTLLDARERPIQMFPVAIEVLADHLALYGATIAHLADPESAFGFEALDYGKRVAHNEAAEALAALLEPVLVLELETARRLFSLTYVLVETLGI